MTVYIRTAVTCDEPKCADAVVVDGASASRVSKERGWGRVRKGGKTLDLCPAHKGGGRP